MTERIESPQTRSKNADSIEHQENGDTKKAHNEEIEIPKTEEFEKKQSSPSILMEVKQLSKAFWLEEKRIKVLHDLDFVVRRGEMIAIMGSSGAGKSTLLHLLGTLDAPTSGSIEILGKDILTMGEEELAAFRNKMIGFVFQSHYLLPEFSALENVMMPALIQRIERKEAKARAEELLNWVNLEDRLSHRPGELSGGERQRVALCRALVMKPQLLLADEPTGNLDAATGEGIHQLLIELNQKWDITTIVVTHNANLAHQMQKCFNLKEGKLSELPQSQMIQKNNSNILH